MLNGEKLHQSIKTAFISSAIEKTEESSQAYYTWIIIKEATEYCFFFPLAG